MVITVYLDAHVITASILAISSLCNTGICEYVCIHVICSECRYIVHYMAMCAFCLLDEIHVNRVVMIFLGLCNAQLGVAYM